MPRAAALDAQTGALIGLAIAVAEGDEPLLREAAATVIAAGTDLDWVEELLLQSILMVGYPRALVAFGVWRAVSGKSAPTDDPDADYARVPIWEARGAATCERVYGGNYPKLRDNVRGLHPAAERWMLVEGYGRTLGRPGLDLMRRELCTVAQTAVLRTHRQLHSHLRGALHGGATPAQVDAVLAAVQSALEPPEWNRVQELWSAVRPGRTEER